MLNPVSGEAVRTLSKESELKIDNTEMSFILFSLKLGNENKEKCSHYATDFFVNTLII